MSGKKKKSLVGKKIKSVTEYTRTGTTTTVTATGDKLKTVIRRNKKGKVKSKSFYKGKKLLKRTKM